MITGTMDARMEMRDVLGTLRIRLGIGRQSYKVEPGLYRFGEPGEDSPVLVTANYKLSVDHLRREISGLDAWLLVLDTKGINVWCAAGKGTFGTEELVRRIEAAGLSEYVSHGKIILPQLGAPGVAAHEVKRRTGFTAVYGPVMARDLKAFLAAGMKATEDMRRKNFPLGERLTQAFVETGSVLKYGAILFAVLAAVLLITGRGLHSLINPAILIAAAVITGSFGAFGLLPWLPGRAFSVKGAVLAALFAAVSIAVGSLTGGMPPTLSGTGLLLLLGAGICYMTLNLTGASTYTSLSGVLKEMRYALPALIAAAGAGLLLWLVPVLLGGKI
ncbi:MAG: acetyl-CoA synthase subunit gamma [Spirochaetales bacterium]|nr:MAG: acetyl-CoA synthase subunit gamma [Spirochaetales bacterium]